MIATVLAVLSVVRINTSGPDLYTYRQKQQWASYAVLQVTQPGFTIGTVDGSGKIQSADPTRFSALAVTLAPFVTSDAVRAIMLRKGPINGSVEAAALTVPSDPADVLPLISIAGLADSKAGSLQLVTRATNSFRQYFDTQQRQNHIAPDNRIVLAPVNAPGNTKLLRDRSQTLPLVVFLTVMIATIALCFVLENLRPRRPNAVSVPERSDERRVG